MNDIFPMPIIGLDVSSSPVLLLAATPDDSNPGAVVPDDCEAFDSLSDFSHYWNEHWRGSGVRVAIPADPIDPLGAHAWLAAIGQDIETYELLGYQAHLRNDLTLENIGIHERYQRPYVLALYANHRQKKHAVAINLWNKLFEASLLVEQIRHSVHRLVASTAPLISPDLALDEIPY